MSWFHVLKLELLSVQAKFYKWVQYFYNSLSLVAHSASESGDLDSSDSA